MQALILLLLLKLTVFLSSLVNTKLSKKKVSKPVQEVNPSWSSSPAKMGHMPKTRQEVDSSKFENKIQSDTSQS